MSKSKDNPKQSIPTTRLIATRNLVQKIFINKEQYEQIGELFEELPKCEACNEEYSHWVWAKYCCSPESGVINRGINN